MNDTLAQLVGDMPVSAQINAALRDMAYKEHIHTEYADRNEVEDLKQKINMLINLVGDMPVSEQIYAAIKDIK